ncbi:MAG TPA: nuclear transport factor 2 family protein [Pyrinomonadaceae bacterium]|nr:nuclear transport factor 2 family protein [Pyrinomonadaceae bacterium]
MNETIQAFVDSINRHDVASLAKLMSGDHVFIDAHGNETHGKETMTAGWRGYFEWFPDYYIEVADVFDNGENFAMFGFAGGSFKGNPDAKWRLPAAWKAIVKDGRIALWQVFADTKIPFELMERR